MPRAAVPFGYVKLVVRPGLEGSCIVQKSILIRSEVETCLAKDGRSCREAKARSPTRFSARHVKFVEARGLGERSRAARRPLAPADAANYRKQSITALRSLGGRGAHSGTRSREREWERERGTHCPAESREEHWAARERYRGEPGSVGRLVTRRRHNWHAPFPPSFHPPFTPSRAPRTRRIAPHHAALQFYQAHCPYQRERASTRAFLYGSEDLALFPIGKTPRSPIH